MAASFATEELGEVVCPDNSRQQRTSSNAPKGQQLIAQGIALGFCVGVGIIKWVCQNEIMDEKMQPVVPSSWEEG